MIKGLLRGVGIALLVLAMCLCFHIFLMWDLDVVQRIIRHPGPAIRLLVTVIVVGLFIGALCFKEDK